MFIKSYNVIIPDDIRQKIREQVKYIALDQQEPITASRWLVGIEVAISSLSQFPQRCATAPENLSPEKKSKLIIRHLIYKKSCRIVFIITKNEVIILNIKHSAQQIIH